MERPAWAPQGTGIPVPSVSRMYGYYLGGSRNSEVDRHAAGRTGEFGHGLPTIMKAGRAFTRRAVKYPRAEAFGQFRQFRDACSGIPPYGNARHAVRDDTAGTALPAAAARRPENLSPRAGHRAGSSIAVQGREA